MYENKQRVEICGTNEALERFLRIKEQAYACDSSSLQDYMLIVRDFKSEISCYISILEFELTINYDKTDFYYCEFDDERIAELQYFYIIRNKTIDILEVLFERAEQ